LILERLAFNSLAFDAGLPASWRLCSLESLSCQIKAGGTPRRSISRYWDGKVPFAKIEDVTRCGGRLEETTERISEEGLANSSAWIVPTDSVVLTMYGTIGVPALVTTPLATNQAIIAIVPDAIVEAEYLMFALLKWGPGMERLNIQSTQKNVNAGIVKAFKVPLPPLVEQRAIAHVLRTVQRAKEQTEQVLDSSQALKRSIAQHLFQNGVVRPDMEDHASPDGDSDPFPVHWSDVSLAEFVSFQRGFDITKKEQQPGPYPVISSSGKKSMHSQYRAEGPGVLIGRKGSVGRVHFVRGNYWPHDTTLWVRDFRGNDPEFVYRLFERFDFSPYITGVANPSLNRNHIAHIALHVPGQREQREIARMLATVDRKIAAEEQRRDALDQLFNSLLHELMTGRLRVDDWPEVA